MAKKKIKNVNAIRDEHSNAVVSNDKAAYLARIAQKNRQQQDLSTANRIEVLESELHRLKVVVETLLTKKKVK